MSSLKSTPSFFDGSQVPFLPPGRFTPLKPNNQWEFQDPKLEVPTIHKAYVRAM